MKEPTIQYNFKAQNAFAELKSRLKSEKRLELKLRVAGKIAKYFGIKKLEKYFYENTKEGTDSDKVAGILLGIFLGLIGVLIAYIIGNKVIIRYTWISFGIVWAIFLLALAFKK